MAWNNERFIGGGLGVLYLNIIPIKIERTINLVDHRDIRPKSGPLRNKAGRMGGRRMLNQLRLSILQTPSELYAIMISLAHPHSPDTFWSPENLKFRTHSIPYHSSSSFSSSFQWHVTRGHFSQI